MLQKRVMNRRRRHHHYHQLADTTPPSASSPVLCCRFTPTSSTTEEAHGEPVGEVGSWNQVGANYGGRFTLVFRVKKGRTIVYIILLCKGAREGGGHMERVVGWHSRGYTRLIYLRVDTKVQDGTLLPLRLPYLRMQTQRAPSDLNCRSKLYSPWCVTYAA